MTTCLQPAADYFLDHYGICGLRPAECLCLPTTEHPKRFWRGRACSHWHPNGATSFADLIRRAHTANIEVREITRG